ncbi:MAG: serine hydrolase [Pseudomonadota bacterium]
MRSLVLRTLLITLLTAIAIVMVFVATNWKLTRNLASFDPMDIWAVETQWPTVLIEGAHRPIPTAEIDRSDVFSDVLHEWESTGGDALIVWHDGEIVLQAYSDDGSPTRLSRSFSMHKSVVGLIAALMDHEGLVDLDAPVAELLPEFEGDARGDLTLRDLLQHRTGFERYPFSPPTLKSLNLMLSDRVEKTALSSQIDSDPSVFDYANVNYQVAGAVLRRALDARANTDYATYLSEKLWQPIGADDAYLWKESTTGAPYFYAGLQASAGDWLRFGVLLAQNGVVDGERIIPEPVIAELQARAEGEPGYGLGLWLGVPSDGPRSYGPSTSLTVENDGPFTYDDVMFLDGFGGQRVMISPSRQTVIVRLGEARFDWNDTRLFNLAAAALDETFPVVDGVETQTTDVQTADGRLVSVRIMEPAQSCDACGTILFSHGAFSTDKSYDAVLEPLARAGHLILIPRHVDAADHPNRDDYPPDTWLPLRLSDSAAVVSALIDQQAPDGSSVAWIAAGHSFGALVAQVLGGADHPAAPPELDGLPTPSRIIALSPPGAVQDYIDPNMFSSIGAPMLVVTGTSDVVPMFADHWCAHLVSHDEAPEGLSTALVFDGEDHYFDGLFGRPVERARTDDDGLLIQSLITFANTGAVIEPEDYAARRESCG